MQKLLTYFSKYISIHAIFNDQSFNDTLTNDIVSFEQLGPGNFTYAHTQKAILGMAKHFLQDCYAPSKDSDQPVLSRRFDQSVLWEPIL